MRVTRSHASQALDTVRRRRTRPSARHRRPRRPAAAVLSVSPMTIDRALRTIDAMPPIRVSLVEAASARLAAGERPTAEAVAEMAIRRVRRGG